MILNGFTETDEFIDETGKRMIRVREYDANYNLISEEIKEAPPEPEPPQPQVEYISREDFDLLDITYKAVTYYITEEDGTITMRQGEE